MALIKSQDAQPLLRDAVVLDLTNPRGQAKAIRDSAVAQAERIVAEARSQAEQVRREAEAAGREQAMRRHDEALRTLEQAWVEAARQWDAERRRMVQEAGRSLIALAVAIAEKVVRRVPRIDPTVVADQAAHAIEHVVRGHDASVRIHPRDRRVLEHILPQLTAQLSGCQHIALVDDASITPGGCVVTSGQGRIDATLERQMERIVETLLPIEAGQEASAA